MLKLLIAVRADCGSNEVKGIGNDVSIELILFLGVNQRWLDILILDLQPNLHGVDELHEPWVLVQGLVVHQTVHLGDPLDQQLDPGQAVVPP